MSKIHGQAFDIIINGVSIVDHLESATFTVEGFFGPGVDPYIEQWVHEFCYNEMVRKHAGMTAQEYYEHFPLDELIELYHSHVEGRKYLDANPSFSFSTPAYKRQLTMSIKAIQREIEAKSSE